MSKKAGTDLNLAKKLNLIVSYIKNNNFAIAETECSKLIRDHPNLCRAWHMSGVIKLKVGKAAGAVRDLRQAAKLDHLNEHILSDLGTALRQCGKLTECVEAYTAGLLINPSNSSLCNNIGNVQLEMCDYVSAEVSFKKTIFLDCKCAQAHSNLGLVFGRCGKVKEAIREFDIALEIDAKLHSAYNNRGIAVKSVGDVSAAAADFLRALELFPSSSEYNCNVGTALSSLGKLAEAQTFLRRSIELDAGNKKAYGALGWVYQKLMLINQAIECYKMSLPPVKGAEDCALLLAGLYYVSKNFSEARIANECLGGCLQGVNGNDLKNSSRWAYYNLIKLLVDMQDDVPKVGDICEQQVCAFGDSHALSASGTHLKLYADKTSSVLTVWSPGCKMWHIANSEENEWKRHLAIFFKLAPIGCTCLVILGEIDCRPNEGIWVATQKKNSNLEIIIADTVIKYLTFIGIIARNDLLPNIVIHGVPAPGYALSGYLNCAEHGEFVAMVRKVNELLCKESLMRGWSFLDVYSATVNDLGLSNGKWHLDGWHMHPSFYANAYPWVRRC